MPVIKHLGKNIFNSYHTLKNCVKINVNSVELWKYSTEFRLLAVLTLLAVDRNWTTTALKIQPIILAQSNLDKASEVYLHVKPRLCFGLNCISCYFLTVKQL